MVEYKFGYSGEHADAFINELLAYTRVNDKKMPRGVNYILGISGDAHYDFYRFHNVAAVIEKKQKRKYRVGTLETYVTVFLDAPSNFALNKALATITQMTGFEPSRKK